MLAKKLSGLGDQRYKLENKNLRKIGKILCLKQKIKNNAKLFVQTVASKR